jgi:predicted transcriptional regulator
MKSKKALATLSRRERQIMDVIYRRGTASAGDVLDAIADPPSYSTIRAILCVLETKGHVKHVAEGTRYVYLPTVSRDRAGRPALASVLETFFDGSTEKAVSALIDLSRSELSDDDFARISKLIDLARSEGR